LAPPPEPDGLRARAVAWVAGTLMPLRWLTVALAAVALAYAGALAWPTAEPWSWVALPAGLALAMVLRFSWAMLAAVLAGLVAAMASGAYGLWLGGYAVLAVTATVVIAVRLLRLLAFDARLERARDVGALVLVVPLAAAAPSLVLGAWVATAQAELWWPSGVAGWSILVLGMLLAGAAGLATDRRVLQALQPQADWRETLLALLAVVSALAALWALPQMGPALQLLTVLAVPLLAAALALRGHFTLAAGATLLGTLVATTALHDLGHPRRCAPSSAPRCSSGAPRAWPPCSAPMPRRWPGPARRSAGSGPSTARASAWPTGTSRRAPASHRPPGAPSPTSARGAGIRRPGWPRCIGTTSPSWPPPWRP
jgi:hypothetical protein